MHMASLSKELLQGLLRGKLGFNGMITTDVTSASGKPAVGDHQSDMMHHGLSMRFRPCLSPLQIRIICRMCR